MIRPPAGLFPGEYGRYGNPTQAAVERKLADLEGGDRALLFASGMGALTVTLTTLLGPGDHLVYTADCYHKTRELIRDFLPRWGITATAVAGGDADAFAAALRSETRLLFIETPSNPFLRVADLPVLIAWQGAQACHGGGQHLRHPGESPPAGVGRRRGDPQRLEVPGRNHDLIAGAAVGSAARLAPVERARGVFGAVGGPMDAYLLLRGLKTLSCGCVVERHRPGAARFLAGHPAVRAVHYPGLPITRITSRLPESWMVAAGWSASNMTATWRRQGICWNGSVRRTWGRRSEAWRVWSSSRRRCALPDPAERRPAEHADNLVRYAAGIEAAEDLIADLGAGVGRIHTQGREVIMIIFNSAALQWGVPGPSRLWLKSSCGIGPKPANRAKRDMPAVRSWWYRPWPA